MSGWDLKKGYANQLGLSKNELLENHKRFFSKKSIMKNLYKVTLYESILEISLEEAKENIFDKLVEKFAKKYWDLNLNPNILITMYNGRSKKSKQEMIIENISENYHFEDIKITFEELNYRARKEYLKKTEQVLKTNVLGALYNDFKRTIYLFDKSKNLVVLNDSYRQLFKENFQELIELNNLRRLELLKLLNDGSEYIKDYFYENNYSFNKNYFEEMEIRIEKLKN